MTLSETILKVREAMEVESDTVKYRLYTEVLAHLVAARKHYQLLLPFLEEIKGEGTQDGEKAHT